MTTVVDMPDLDRKVRAKGPMEFAPPMVRGEGLSALEQIRAFGDLPTKDLDDMLEAAENNLASLKAEAQIIRDLYTQQTAKLTTEIKRFQEGVKLSKAAMEELRSKCDRLNALDGEPSK